MIAVIMTRMGVRISVGARFNNTITITIDGKGNGDITLPDDGASTTQIRNTVSERLGRLRAGRRNKVRWDTMKVLMYECMDTSVSRPQSVIIRVYVLYP